jgi:hypothetical protein
LDAETWNDKVSQMNAASARSQRIVRLHEALGLSVAEAADLGASSAAERLRGLHAETFYLAALAQSPRWRPRDRTGGGARRWRRARLN